MSDPAQPPPTELTDETIYAMVAFVEAAESLAASMGMPVSRAYRFMLESGRAMQRLASGLSFNLPSLPTKGSH